MVQTSREGIKFGDLEVSNDLVKKIASVTFSATVVILRTGDLSAFKDE
jgi:hypothetical protein